MYFLCFRCRFLKSFRLDLTHVFLNQPKWRGPSLGLYGAPQLQLICIFIYLTFVYLRHLAFTQSFHCDPALFYVPNTGRLFLWYKHVFQLGGSFLCPPPHPTARQVLFMNIRKMSNEEHIFTPFQSAISTFRETSQLQKRMTQAEHHDTVLQQHTRLLHCSTTN